jgi:hypothetical protein
MGKYLQITFFSDLCIVWHGKNVSISVLYTVLKTRRRILLLQNRTIRRIFEQKGEALAGGLGPC